MKPGTRTATEARMRILLVDDQPDNLLAMEAALECLGQELVKAQSGREALKRLLEEEFALILLDVHMPDMDGFETAALIRQNERLRCTPIIFLTAVEKTMDRVHQGYRAGAVDYLFVPYSAEILRSKVAVFIELAKKTEELTRQAKLLELRGRELERRTADLEAINRELDAFTYSVSHDLRAPLRRIDGFSKTLLEEYGPQLDAAARRYLERVREGAVQMGRLVEDLLNLSRVGRWDLSLQLTGLNSLVQETLADLKPEMKGREIEWRVGHLPFVECDPALMKQVCVNLLSNALKYTRPRKRAVIQVDQMTIEGAPAIYVRDNGVGFNMKHAAKLFGIFQRLHRSEDFEGTGVGLAIAQRIIHKHGGRIWAEAEVDKGATFYFTLGVPRESKPESESHSNAKGKL